MENGPLIDHRIDLVIVHDEVIPALEWLEGGTAAIIPLQWRDLPELQWHCNRKVALASIRTKTQLHVSQYLLPLVLLLQIADFVRKHGLEPQLRDPS